VHKIIHKAKKHKLNSNKISLTQKYQQNIKNLHLPHLHYEKQSAMNNYSLLKLDPEDGLGALDVQKQQSFLLYQTLICVVFLSFVQVNDVA
jgi:hypothetical protein